MTITVEHPTGIWRPRRPSGHRPLTGRVRLDTSVPDVTPGGRLLR